MAPFAINVRQINYWKEKQKPRLDVYELPEISESTKGRTPGKRIQSLAIAALMLGMPLVIFFVLLVPFAPKLEGGMKIFAYLAFGVFALTMVKNAFSALGESLGTSSRGEVLWQAGKKFEKEYDRLASVRCFGEALTFPWEKRSDPTTDEAYDVLVASKGDSKVPQDLLIAVGDLLFVDMWLEISLNADESFTGLSNEEAKTYREKMGELVSDSGKLKEFVFLMVEMGRGQETEEQGPHQVLEELANLLRKNAPKTAAIIPKKPSANTPAFQKIRSIYDVVKFILEGEDINVKDEKGRTLLHLAAEEGREELVDTLLAYGANHQIKDMNGRKAMDFAKETGHSNIVASLENICNMNYTFPHSQPYQAIVIRLGKELKDLSNSHQGLLFIDMAEKGLGEENSAKLITQNVLPALQFRLSHRFVSPAFGWANWGGLFKKQEITIFLEKHGMDSDGVAYFQDGEIKGYKKFSRLGLYEEKIQYSTELVLGDGDKKSIPI